MWFFGFPPFTKSTFQFDLETVDEEPLCGICHCKFLFIYLFIYLSIYLFVCLFYNSFLFFIRSTYLRFDQRLLCGKENVSEQAMYLGRKKLNKRYPHQITLYQAIPFCGKSVTENCW